MAKLNRESKLREKRAEKQARKAARKMTAAGDAAHRPIELGAAPAGLEAGVRDGAGPEWVAAVSDASGGAG